MLHQALVWLEHFDIRLWSFSLQHSVYLWNRLLQMESNLSPIEIYTSIKQDNSTLGEKKVWSCPAYVLDPRLQDGKKIPKWD